MTIEELVAYLRRDLHYLEGLSSGLKPRISNSIWSKIRAMRTNIKGYLESNGYEPCEFGSKSEEKEED